jgi:FAD/FMN-containing dehydrogenase
MPISASLRQDLGDVPLLGHGVSVSNPHTFILDNAGWKRVDAPQAEFKRIADPYGLMNPGKLKEWKAQQLRAIAS